MWRNLEAKCRKEIKSFRHRIRHRFWNSLWKRLSIFRSKLSELIGDKVEFLFNIGVFFFLSEYASRTIPSIGKAKSFVVVALHHDLTTNNYVSSKVWIGPRHEERSFICSDSSVLMIVSSKCLNKISISEPTSKRDSIHLRTDE